MYYLFMVLSNSFVVVLYEQQYSLKFGISWPLNEHLGMILCNRSFQSIVIMYS